jgi:hypothetical protein
MEFSSGTPFSWNTSLYNHVCFLRRAISVPAAMPAPNPKANMPILTGDETSPQIVTDAEAANIKNKSAMMMTVLFDFIFALSWSCS